MNPMSFQSVLRSVIVVALVLGMTLWIVALAPMPKPQPVEPIHDAPVRLMNNPPRAPQGDASRAIEPRFAGCMATDCHPGKKAYPFLHGPMFVDACDTCHVLSEPKTHLYELARTPEKLCVFCHEFDIDHDAMIHQPFEQGICLPCHNPHGGDTPSLLKSDHYSDLCLSCHDDLLGTRNLIHGPASAGACGACHEPHASKERMLLDLDGRAMCLRCHVSLDIEIETARVVHEPVLNDCQLCHNPHATDNPSLLLDEPAALCMKCHEDIHQTVEHAKTSHGALLTERSCLNCHSPHASDHPRLLSNDIESLCFECHNKEIVLDDGRRIANIEAIIETGTSLHGPVASGNCVACHEIHGGDNSRLLVRAYSGKLYAPFSKGQYALCFGCHDQALATQAQTTTATRFRNGQTNLHFVHVNRDHKGRTCSVCHDAHAAKRDEHIHEAVPFGPGGWKLPIQFQRIGDGGSCASGCHKSLQYSRSNPLIYTPRPEGGIGDTPQPIQPAQSSQQEAEDE